MRELSPKLGTKSTRGGRGTDERSGEYSCIIIYYIQRQRILDLIESTSKEERVKTEVRT
jgi:hypothetical protein